MQDVNVLITFCSRTGRTEKLALAAAVGAVQGRANIRLRRIDAAAGEYVVPREADAEWADALISGTPGCVGAASEGWAEYLHLLETLRSRGKLDGKVGAAFTTGAPGQTENQATLASLCGAMAQLGLIVVSLGEANIEDRASEAGALQGIRFQGRRVAGIARAMKQARV